MKEDRFDVKRGTGEKIESIVKSLPTCKDMTRCIAGVAIPMISKQRASDCFFQYRWIL